MSIFVPLCSFGKQFALHLCDWSRTGTTYGPVTAEELDTCVKNYTQSFITGSHLPFSRAILECPAFQLALTSEEVGRYAIELGECTEEKKFQAIMARILLCCCMDIPHDMGDSYDTVLHCINRYSSGLIRKLAKTFKRDFLKTSRTFLLEKFPVTNLLESNASHYAHCYQEPLYWEKYAIYDDRTASLQDCYVSPAYYFQGKCSHFHTVPLEELLALFLCDTVCPAISDLPKYLHRKVHSLAQRSTALIRGPHGSGKTSLLYKLASDILDGRYKTDRCFLGIELKSLANTTTLEPDGLLGAVLEHLNCGTDELENSILCLDGIDDLLLLLGKETLVDTYIARLAVDIAKIPGCKCVVTASSGKISDDAHETFWVVELCELSEDSRDELVQKYTAVHPAVHERFQNISALPLRPDQLYTVLALSLPTPQVDYWPARIAKVEQLWQDREPAVNTEQLLPMAETLAVCMLEQQTLTIRNPAVDCAIREKTDEIFLQEAYGLTCLEDDSSFAVRFRSLEAVYYLGARKTAKEADASLQIGVMDLESWCNLFSKYPLSEKFLSYYQNFLSHPREKSDMPFVLMNATLAQNRLLSIFSDNLLGMEYYLKNLPNLCRVYRNSSYHTSLDSSAFLRCLTIAQGLGAQMDNFSILDMDFLDDVQHFTFTELELANCAFVNCKISFCQLRKVIRDTLFSNTVFSHCNLSQVKFVNCRFLHCRFEHCDFTEASFQGTMKHTVFTDCDFNYAKIEALHLRGCAFTNSRLRLCAFRHLDGCSFQQTDISAASFRGLDLRNIELEDLYMSGVYGANFWRNTAAPALCFKGCSILLRQIKNIYQFLEDISDVKVFDDENPTQPADPLAVSCEYLFCQGQPIPQEDLCEFANRFWPDGIKVEES